MPEQENVIQEIKELTNRIASQLEVVQYYLDSGRYDRLASELLILKQLSFSAAGAMLTNRSTR